MYHIKEDKRNQLSAGLMYKSLVKLVGQNNSFEKINIKTLVEMAGVGRATFYRSFDVIDDVLKYQTDQMTQELIGSVYSELKKQVEFSENEIFLAFFKFWFDHTELLGTLIKARRYWLFENSFDDLFKAKLVFIKDLLNIPDGVWPYFIKIRTAMLTSVLAEWVIRGKKETPDELVAILLKSFTHVKINPNQFSI